MDKKALRKELLAKRQTLSAEQRAAYGRAILQHLSAMPEMQAAQTILMYLDFRGEVESEGLIEWGLAQGKTVCAPITVVEERRLIPVKMTSPTDVQLGAYNIREPILREGFEVAVEAIDAVVLPGVGFDRHGGRLGYGGGYYDRFLPRLRPGVPKIAVAYELQVLDDVPREPHDCVLTALVTEKGVWRAGE
ncbi:MAG: 5-formyltetrahydrofolate cyclo-ligase [Tumebacillaceae bacterium]